VWAALDGFPPCAGRGSRDRHRLGGFLPRLHRCFDLSAGAVASPLAVAHVLASHLTIHLVQSLLGRLG
jgi:hypothetical protein